ncbi:MAG: hypothetical protein ACYTGV_14400, partial [Planctomycetota bacterium]
MNRIAVVLLLCAASAFAEDILPKLRGALVKLHVEILAFDNKSPWKKQRARSMVSRGVLIQEGVILTRASNVVDAHMIEFSVANSARRYAANLKHRDSRVGLALLEITDPDAPKNLAPLEIGEPVKLDDEFDIYQLGGDNMVERYTARVVRADASSTQLSMRLQTTCSDTGNGQTAIRDGRLVGLVTATNARRQEGTILSVETIKRYLRDFDDGDYKGCPSGGMFIQPLLRDDLRTFYGVPDDKHGLVVTRVMPGRTGDGTVRPGDVLLKVDGYDIDDEGKFTHEVHGRLNASYLFQGRRYAGDKIPLTVLRDGKEVELELELRNWPGSEMRVPPAPHDKRPEFLVTAGLVILELHEGTARGMTRTPGGVILRRYNERKGWDPPTERERIVYV